MAHNFYDKKFFTPLKNQSAKIGSDSNGLPKTVKPSKIN
ncbi:hypothetical protein AO385_0229 [Moraxella catarrhalis]|uniref:Uncharacterized protein n=1 Tax=Moraxella catarrhalis TaxID=480 RepID=A0A198UHK7_MORCA|nr:hypothetical protein AO384_1183 [Moraxella catarrhalis]OAU97883.1 hypothetical protein AO383_0834 [Moraxella catarrhalis]OAV01015.1 hypothetical protein AO382_0992 [Moraxella catarrhalis]OAV04038.1 hypothetical protein AO385_0229 [Moraxella catarrhalis]